MPENVSTKSTPEEIEEQSLDRKKGETALAVIKRYARSAEIQKRFENMLGNQAGKSYIESIIIAATNDEALQQCSPKSIMISAMRAASLKLSVDPALRQAHLVPFNKNATLIVDYHGLVQLTTQTGMYRVAPNVSPVFEGEIVEVNRFSGVVNISGTKAGDTIIGWVGYFRDINGVERYLYMTNKECDAHGEKYNPGGFHSKKSAWATDRDKMRRKTVLRMLVTQWGYYSPAVKTVLFDENSQEVIDAQLEDLPEPEDVAHVEEEEESPEQRTESQNLSQLGFSPDPVPDRLWNDWRNLCIRAGKVGLPFAHVKRENITQPEMKAAYDELLRFVLDAEEQATVGA